MEQLELFKPLTRTERQKQGIKCWISNKCVGTLEWATGTGKTRTALMAATLLIKKYPTLKVIVIVPTEPLQRQWIKQIDESGLGLNCEVLIINTAVKGSRSCDLLIIDELHRAGSNEFSKVFNIKYKYILGLTATLERLDGKHSIIEKYCPIVDRISTIEAVANGWLAENVEYKIILDVDNIGEYKELTKQFNQHFEFFQYNFKLAMSMLGKDGYKKRSEYRDLIMKSNPKLDSKQIFREVTYHAMELSRVLQTRKKFINTHPDKIRLTREIIKHRPNSKIITFSATIDIAEEIGIGNVYSSKDSKKKGKMTMDEFNKAEVAVLNTSKKCDEGLDSPNLSVAIILGQDSSPTRFIQRKGRVIRKEGDKISEIFIFVINDTVESEWFNSNHKGSDKSIAINEENLMKVLNGEPYETYKRPVSKFTFRF